RQSGRPGVGKGVCKCVSGRPGAQNRRLGVGGGVYVGKGNVGRPGAQNWHLGVGEGVCKCVSGHPGTQNRRLGVGGGMYVGKGDVGRPGAQNWRLGVGDGGLGSVCWRPGASFGRHGVSVVVQEGGVGVLGALGVGFGQAPSFSAALSRGISGLKPIVNYRVLYIDTKPRMLTL
ncbi:hypothetical protein PIB30_097593, partial [Stylosanthes scabra]|nr:hypothetical protein [Stylosanthes scabra]